MHRKHEASGRARPIGLARFVVDIRYRHRIHCRHGKKTNNLLSFAGLSDHGILSRVGVAALSARRNRSKNRDSRDRAAHFQTFCKRYFDSESP